MPDAGFMVLAGIVVGLIGAVNYRYARAISRFSERVDAIGSARSWAAVEPAEWKVGLTKVGGAVVVGLGGCSVAWGLLMALGAV